jgi:hypothetical protein
MLANKPYHQCHQPQAPQEVVKKKGALLCYVFSACQLYDPQSCLPAAVVPTVATIISAANFLFAAAAAAVCVLVQLRRPSRFPMLLLLLALSSVEVLLLPHLCQHFYYILQGITPSNMQSTNSLVSLATAATDSK